MASRSKGQVWLAALMIISACAGSGEETHPVSPDEAIKRFAASVTERNDTYEEFAARVRGAMTRENVSINGMSVPAIAISGLGRCIAVDNRTQVFADRHAKRVLSEYTCFVDDGQVRLSQLQGKFGRMYLAPAPIDRVTPLVIIEGLTLPSGREAYEIGFETDPAQDVRMTIVVESGVDLGKVARLSGQYPMLSGSALDEAAAQVMLRRIHFLRDLH